MGEPYLLPEEQEFFFFIIPVNGGAIIGNFPEALSS